MAETFTIRISKDTPSFNEMDEAAARLGMSRNQMIIEGIKMMCSWDKQFYSKMRTFGNTFKLPIPLIMQNMLIKRLAEDYANEEVWGFNGRMMMEFTFNERGPITGGELFQLLANEAMENERKEKFKVLHNDVTYGVPLSEDDMAFYEQNKAKYMPAPPLKPTKDIKGIKSIAYWEGEMTDEEAIKKLMEEDA